MSQMYTKLKYVIYKDSNKYQMTNMAARNKIIKPVGQEPDALELEIAQYLADMEKNVSELKADLRGLQFTAAKEVCRKNE